MQLERLLISASRVGCNVDEIPELDQDELVTRALQSHLAPLLHCGINKQALDPKAASALKTSYQKVLMSNIRKTDLFAELLTKFNQAEIPITPLKGLFLAEKIYEDIGLRHLSDMDVLVRDEDVEPARELIESEGWSIYEHHRQSSYMADEFATPHPYIFEKNGEYLELHVHVQEKGIGYQISIDDYWSRSFEADFGKGRIRQLCGADLLQHLCIHLHKHLIGSELKVVSFCDIRELIKKSNSSIDWSLLSRSSVKYGCLNEVQVILHLCKKVWSTEVPQEILNGLDSSEALKSEELFWTVFRQGQLELTEVRSRKMEENLSRLSTLNSFPEKAKFVWDYLFPTADYMRQRYGVRGLGLVASYIYRPISVLAKLVALTLRKLT